MTLTIANNTGATFGRLDGAGVLTQAMLKATDDVAVAAGITFTVDAVPLYGTLALSGTALAVTDSFTQADVNSGLVTYTHGGTANYSDTFTFTVDDGGSETVEGAFAVAVTPRTTRALVGTIIELDSEVVPDDAAMEPFILVANEMVTEACVTGGPTTPYNATRLELIERWLAAHLYTNRDPRVVNEKAGSVGQTFQSKVDLGFDTSHFGQTAMRLDTNGTLSKINEDTKKGKPRVGVFWPGTRASQVDSTYQD